MFITHAASGDDGAAAAITAPSTADLSLMDAVNAALARLPDIQMQEHQVEVEQGQVQASRGKFDLQLEAQTSLTATRTEAASSNRQVLLETRPDTPPSYYLQGQETRDRTEQTDYEWGGQASLSKLLETGMSLEGIIGLDRRDSDVRGRQRLITDVSETVSSLNVDTVHNNETLQFSLVLPLARGRGRDATTAPVRMAEERREAAIAELSHTASQAVGDCVIAYWNCLAARESLLVTEQSLERARLLLADLEKLVAADERPAADLGPSRADAAAREAARESARQTLLEARIRLALAMGLDETAIPQGNMADAFPAPESIVVPQDLSGWEALALRLRADLDASRRNESAYAWALVSARDQLRPEVNLTAGVSYQHTRDDKRLAFPLIGAQDEQDVYQTGVTMSVSYPFRNNAARGQYHAQKALQQQARLSTWDLERNIRANLVSDVGAVQNAISRLHAARAAVEAYTRSMEDETKKLRHGFSTILDVLNMFDRLKDAQLNLVSAQLALSNAIIQVRYETGALIAERDGIFYVEREWLTALPSETFP